MKIRYILSILTAKFAIIACRLFRRGGTSLPGKLALKIYPNVLRETAKNFRIIMVTGTNGKTTTTKMIGQILKDNNIGYITNKSGANLVSGIVTTFIENVNYRGDSGVSTALLEIDEAAFNAVTNHISPDILVVTNFFRDQLDRYGELYTTVENVASGIRKSPNAKLVLNADDSLCASLGKNAGNEVIYYGFDPGACKGVADSGSSDANFCIYCKTRYEYDSYIYGHLGWFRCPTCGYARPESNVACTEVEELSATGSAIRLRLAKPSCIKSDTDNTEQFSPCDEISAENVLSAEKSGLMNTECNGLSSEKGGIHAQNKNEIYSVKISLPGLYNIYNALAAVGCSRALDTDMDTALASLSKVESGFGRMETIDAGGKTVKVILIKNPAGFNQVINYLLTEKKNFVAAFIINDRIADGTDVSWLWDVDFEKMQPIFPLMDSVYVSGTRAGDMAVRLKYCGMDTDKIEIERNYGRLIDKALADTPEGHTLYLLPTYTAMLDIRKHLKNKFRLRDFWK